MSSPDFQAGFSWPSATISHLARRQPALQSALADLRQQQVDSQTVSDAVLQLDRYWLSAIDQLPPPPRSDARYSLLITSYVDGRPPHGLGGEEYVELDATPEGLSGQLCLLDEAGLAVVLAAWPGAVQAPWVEHAEGMALRFTLGEGWPLPKIVASDFADPGHAILVSMLPSKDARLQSVLAWCASEKVEPPSPSSLLAALPDHIEPRWLRAPWAEVCSLLDTLAMEHKTLRVQGAPVRPRL